MSALLRFGEAAVLVYFLLLNAVYLAFFLGAFRAVRRSVRGRLYEDLSDIFQSPLTPPVSVLVPAFNEAAGIAVCVGNLLHMDYPRFEVVVVNDGSTDGTLAALKAAFALAPAGPEEAGALATRRVRAVYRSGSHDNLIVIDKDNGGEADALNAGLNAAQHPYFCAVGADDILEPDALLRLAREVLEAPVRVVGVGGAVRMANGCRVEKGRIREINLAANPLCVFQAVEYFRAFLGARVALSQVNGLMILSGAFSLFERELVCAMGGYRTDTVGEDMELVTRLHRHLRDSGERGYAIRFVPDPVCWTEVPSSLAALARQRRRWQRGLLEVLGRNSALLFEPRYGAVGTFTYPFLFLFEGWGMLLEGLGYVLFLASLRRGAVNADFALAFLALAVLGGAALSLAGVLLGEVAHRRYPLFRQLVALVLFGVLESLCYRPLTVFMRLLGVADYVRGAAEWGRMERSGSG